MSQIWVYANSLVGSEFEGVKWIIMDFTFEKTDSDLEE